MAGCYRRHVQRRDGSAGYVGGERELAAHRRQLSSTVDEATWVLTSYIVANAVILQITGWLANYFGRKRLLLTVVTGFTVSSVLCGLAPNLPLLILFRVLQGTTGGGLQPISQAVLLEEFPGPERGKAMAFWGMGIVTAPILGPTLGGWIRMRTPGAGFFTSTCRSESSA
jgi:MFS family permease